MQPDDMEKAFRQKMKSHTPAWDKNKNWDAIEAQLPQQRRRRAVWLFWLLGVAMTGAVLWWGWAGENETTVAGPIADTTKVIENQLNTTTAQADVTWTESISPQAETTESIVGSSNVDRVLNPADVGATKTQHGTPVSTSSGQTTKMDVDATTVISPQAANTELAAETTVATNEDAPGVTRLPLIDALEKLPVETRPLDLPEAEIELAEASVERTEVLQSGSHFALEIYGGIGQPLRRFSAVSPEKQAYIDERQERETVLESIEAGVLITSRFRGGWSLATGLEFQKINERFRWQRQSTETVNVYSDTAYFYFDDLNQRQYLGDTVQATLTESRRVTNFNAHTFLNVPVLIGFEKRLPHFSLRAQGGPVLQFYRGFEGVIFDENDELLPAGEQGIYQNKMALSLQAGLDISRPVGQLGEVFVGLQYRHGLTSLTDASAGFEQRYGSLGARLGWRF